MLITLYTPIGIVYQNFEITENDIIYGDLIKYMMNVINKKQYMIEFLLKLFS